MNQQLVYVINSSLSFDLVPPRCSFFKYSFTDLIVSLKNSKLEYFMSFNKNRWMKSTKRSSNKKSLLNNFEKSNKKQKLINNFLFLSICFHKNRSNRKMNSFEICSILFCLFLRFVENSLIVELWIYFFNFLLPISQFLFSKIYKFIRIRLNLKSFPQIFTNWAKICRVWKEFMVNK